MSGKSFTVEYPNIAFELKTPIAISPPVTKNSMSDFTQYNAIWDTGAALTGISPRIVKDYNLKPSGMIKTIGIEGNLTDKDTYLLNVILFNNLEIHGLTVAQISYVGDGSDVLIGMNLITLGDFAVTNQKNRTVFSFRSPSDTTISFPGEVHEEKIYSPSESIFPKIGRNDPCPCGSGKKYKKCHGK